MAPVVPANDTSGNNKHHKRMSALLKHPLFVAVFTATLGVGAWAFEHRPSPKAATSDTALVTFATTSPPVVVGMFRFTLVKLVCGEQTRVEYGLTRVTTPGQFCNATIDVENMSDTERGFPTQAILTSGNQRSPVLDPLYVQPILPYAAKRLLFVFETTRYLAPTTLTFGDLYSTDEGTVVLHVVP